MVDTNVFSSQSTKHSHAIPSIIISDISTHTPLTGNNSTLTPVSKLRSTFQSTLSSLRAIQNGQQHQPSDYFNPRSPHRERLKLYKTIPLCNKFQSSLPSQGATKTNVSEGWENIFQSSLPSQGATLAGQETPRTDIISIHAPLTGSNMVTNEMMQGSQISILAPLTGSDMTARNFAACQENFNPRSPHRERHL